MLTGMDMVGLFLSSSECFRLTFISDIDQPQCTDNYQENHERHHRVDDMHTHSHHHPASMPPPPMPASLDPTTISTKPSINTNQQFESPLTTLIPPSISPLTSFANLSLLSPALLRSTPPPSLLIPFTHPPSTPVMTTPFVPPPRDNDAAAWSPLRRHTAALSSTSPLPASVSLSSCHNDNNSIVSSPPPTTITTDNVARLVGSPSCTPSPSPSPSSIQPETLFMDTNSEIQSTPHSPDPTWRADSPSGDHVNPAIGLESQSGVFVTSLAEVQKGALVNVDGHHKSPVLDVNGEDHMDVGVSPSRSPSDAFQVHQGDTNMAEEKTPELSGLNQSPTINDVTSSEPPPLLPNSVSVSTSQHNSTAQSQPALKEEESRPQEPSHPPAPKVKMSLRDFALRKKRQREEEEMTKNVQDTPSSGGVNLPFVKSETGPNGVGRADRESTNEKAVVDGINGLEVKAAELKEDLVDDLKKDSPYYGASALPPSVVKDEVVDVPETSSLKPTSTNGYHDPSPPPAPPTLLARIQAGTSSVFTYPTPTRQSKQELIEQPIPAATIQPTIMDSMRYAAMYNNSGSISPINPDPHHFASYSPPQEDGEIGEILDTPLRLPSSSSTSFLTAPPAMNRLAPIAAVPSSSLITPLPRGPTTFTGSDSPLPRGPTSKRADFGFTRSVSSSQIRHSPPTHPRSYNASPPCRQPPSTSAPPPARGTGVPPPTAPRALRQYMTSNRPTPTTPNAMTPSSYPPAASSTSSSTPTPVSSTAVSITTSGGRVPPYIPRGPSADRDRGWDMDQTQYARSLSRRNSREGGHAWGGR